MIWICPPEFAPSFNFINEKQIIAFDQTIWIFDDVDGNGYVNGKFYTLIGNKYSYGY